MFNFRKNKESSMTEAWPGSIITKEEFSKLLGPRSAKVSSNTQGSIFISRHVSVPLDERVQKCFIPSNTMVVGSENAGTPHIYLRENLIRNRNISYVIVDTSGLYDEMKASFEKDGYIVKRLSAKDGTITTTDPELSELSGRKQVVFVEPTDVPDKNDMLITSLIESAMAKCHQNADEARATSPNEWPKTVYTHFIINEANRFLSDKIIGGMAVTRKGNMWISLLLPTIEDVREAMDDDWALMMCANCGVRMLYGNPVEKDMTYFSATMTDNAGRSLITPERMHYQNDDVCYVKVESPLPASAMIDYNNGEDNDVTKPAKNINGLDVEDIIFVGIGIIGIAAHLICIIKLVTAGWQMASTMQITWNSDLTQALLFGLLALGIMIGLRIHDKRIMSM